MFQHQQATIIIKKQYKLQQQIAVEAARLINEEGIDSLHNARIRAARSLGVNDQKMLPDDSEIIFQIQTYQLLYQTSENKAALKNLRTIALNAMKLFKNFNPKLIGSVLLGYAHEHSSIDILVSADSAEEVAIQLMSHDIPYQLHDWKLYFNRPGTHNSTHHGSKDGTESVPSYQFYADKLRINLIVLLEKKRKMTPLEPHSWQVMQKASLPEVELLLKK